MPICSAASTPTIPWRAHEASIRGRTLRSARCGSPRSADRGGGACIARIVDTNMVGALRSVLIERGLDPRDFVLCAFGGATRRSSEAP